MIVKEEAELVNNLTFASVYKSITSFEPILLPGLVVLTGINGSGKTHLLSAIKAGNVRSSLVTDYTNDARLYDSTNIVPADTGVFDPHQHQAQRSNQFQAMRSYRDAVYPGLRNAAITLGVPASYCSSLEKLEAVNKQVFEIALKDEVLAEERWGEFQRHVKHHADQVLANFLGQNGDEDWRNKMRRIGAENPRAYLYSSLDEFYRNPALLWNDVDPFQQAFGQVFVTYRKLLHDNLIYREFPPGSGVKERYLTPEEFENEYSTPPWEFVNRILEESKLDFRVDSPPLHEMSSYEPKLTKISSGVEMRFQDLSSGEKVLMSFALCLYNTKEKRQEKNFPKLLLLDEIDAPLHPSMAASLLATIKNVLVDERKVAVIMTTHSPSTVALAPEDSIFVMDPNGPRIVKTSKGAALSILTAGVPTLSVSFDGRRQVFVESFRDAKIYDSLYQRYKGFLHTERSLAFVEVGRTNVDGVEQNAGCTQVLRLVDDLARGGNYSVLGLVDWDGDRQATDRIHVLSHGVRDGLESLLYDPLLLLALLVRENSAYMVEKGLFSDHESYTSLASWSSDCWQSHVDNLQNYIFGEQQETVGFIEVEYLSGVCLKVRQDYLHFDDHRLENKLVELFGFIKPKQKGSGLMQYVIDTVLKEHPSFVPKDLLLTLEALLTVDFHQNSE
jgi:ABC-type molybdenum transport system ATPase subunit/photorepair protein PhrA